MDHEGGARDESAPTALERTRDHAGLVNRREFVRAKVVRVLEKALAGDAVAIGVLLAAVLVQAKLVLEELDGQGWRFCQRQGTNMPL